MERPEISVEAKNQIQRIIDGAEIYRPETFRLALQNLYDMGVNDGLTHSMKAFGEMLNEMRKGKDR